jgi:hypothetical protein
MAQVRVHYRQDSGAVHAYLHAHPGEVDRDLHARAENVLRLARRYVRKRTGRLARSLRITRAGAVGYRVGSPLGYALVEHEGRRRIRVTRRARGSDRPGALRFKPKGAGRFIFRREVGPAQGSHFLIRALVAARRR